MAQTTFSGPLRTENGFEQIEIAEGTGAVTTNFTVSTDSAHIQSNDHNSGCTGCLECGYIRTLG